MVSIPINNKRCPTVYGIQVLIEKAVVENQTAETVKMIRERMMSKVQYKALMRYMRRFRSHIKEIVSNGA